MTVALATNYTAQAGEMVSPAPAPIEPACDFPLSSEFSAGYDSLYVFRGLWFGDDTVWANVDFAYEVSPNLTWSANAFYTDVQTNNVYSEFNLGTNLSYTTDYGTWDFGFLYYNFPDGFGGRAAVGPAAQGDASELYIGYSREIFWGIDMSLLAAWDMRIDAAYYEFGISKSWDLTQCASFELAYNVGYSGNDYYASLGGDDQNDFTHSLVSASLPIALSDVVTFTPYCAVNFSHGARENSNAGIIGSEAFFAGASIAVTF